MGKTICFYATDEVESILDQVEESLNKKIKEHLKKDPKNTRSKIIQTAIIEYATGMIDPKKTAILALLKAIDTLRDYMEINIDYPSENYLSVEALDTMNVFHSVNDPEQEKQDIREYFKARREIKNDR